MLQKFLRFLIKRFESMGEESIELYTAQDTGTFAFRALKKTPGNSRLYVMSGEIPGVDLENAKETFVSTARRILQAPNLQVNDQRFPTKQALQAYARNQRVWWLIDKV